MEFVNSDLSVSFSVFPMRYWMGASEEVSQDVGWSPKRASVALTGQVGSVNDNTDIFPPPQTSPSLAEA